MVDRRLKCRFFQRRVSHLPIKLLFSNLYSNPPKKLKGKLLKNTSKNTFILTRQISVIIHPVSSLKPKEETRITDFLLQLHLLSNNSV